MKKIIQLTMFFFVASCSTVFAATDYFPRSVENVYTLENNRGVGNGDFNFFFDLTQGIPAWMYDNETVSRSEQKGGYTFTTGKKSKKPSNTITYQSNK